MPVSAPCSWKRSLDVTCQLATPRTLGVKAILERFIAHRRDVVTRRTRYELRKAKEREHILLGYKIALDHIDEIIALIKASAKVAPVSSTPTGLEPDPGGPPMPANTVTPPEVVVTPLLTVEI